MDNLLYFHKENIAVQLILEFKKSLKEQNKKKKIQFRAKLM